MLEVFLFKNLLIRQSCCVMIHPQNEEGYIMNELQLFLEIIFYFVIIPAAIGFLISSAKR